MDKPDRNEFLVCNGTRGIIQTGQAKMIDTQAQLRAAVDRLASCRTIAMDLEADAMFHFREKVCLIQLALPGQAMALDPLAIEDLSLLGPLLADPCVEKVFHGADFDVRSLYRDFGFEIHNLFDTQIACRFLGMAATGLDAVLDHFFGIHLNKKFQKKNWSQRPLPDDMLDYALGDVVYLLELAEVLKGLLREKNRLGWVVEESQLLSQVRPAPVDNGPLFLRFKGAARLGRRSLAVLEALLILRRDMALQKDRPLFKVLSDGAILELVQRLPRHMEMLTASNILKGRQLDLLGDKVLAAIQNALDLPEANLPIYPRKAYPVVDPGLAPVLKELKQWRDRQAQALGLEPPVLFSKALLTAIADVKPRSRRQLDGVAGLRQWQKEAFGGQIIAVVARQG
jgi:ribonuclease D